MGTHEDAYFYGKYSYHANGSIATEELHEMDIERTYSYNAQGLLTGIGGDYFTQSLTYTSGGYDGDSYYTGLIASTSYGYSWSNPGTGYPTAPSGYTWRYRYDSRGQLLTAENTLGSAYSVGVGSTNVMQYDAHGNITRFNQGNTTRSNTYVAGTNRLYHNSWLLYDYDTSGRIIGREASMGIETFSYDPYVGKPVTVMGQLPVRYGYGGGSQRVLKEVNYTSPSPQKTVYIHGLGDYPLAEYRNHGPDPVTRYVYGPSGLLAIHKGLQGTILFPLKDHLGSSRVVLETKPSGGGRQVKPLAVYDYWPFGADMETAGGVAGYRYTGQEYEAETDAYNYRARLYSQHMGHFMAPDPAGQFHSPYVAMGNNPVNMVDPDGEWVVPALYYAYKAYQYYNYAKAAYNIYQAFDKGGMHGGIQSIIGTAISIGASTVIGGNVQGGSSLRGNMLAGGVGSMMSSGTLSLAYGGSFRDGFSLNNAFSGIISAGGEYLEGQHAMNKYYKNNEQAAGLPNYHQLSNSERGEYILEYLRNLKIENREIGDPREIFDFYHPSFRRAWGPEPTMGLVKIAWTTTLSDVDVPIEILFQITGQMVNNNRQNIFYTTFGFRESHLLFSLISTRANVAPFMFRVNNMYHAWLFAREFYINQPLPTNLERRYGK